MTSQKAARLTKLSIATKGTQATKKHRRKTFVSFVFCVAKLE
jgi:hypothetical protein